MRKYLYIVALLALSGLYFPGKALAQTQPEISYMIPDIGAPGMSTYVEIVAPYNAIGSFGSDGLYLNNSTDAVRVEFERIGDYDSLVLGPLVVSWSGRLISMQIFVKPGVSPNSWEWDKLDPAYRVPLRVFANNQASVNTDTFYIVQPFPFGNKSSLAESVLGQGNLGKRSRRGAMLVDSMILGAKTYSVSVNDCDPATPGNQSYLPFVVLSKGRIVSPAGTAIIAANANGIDGGPGGGGGGGYYCDRVRFTVPFGPTITAGGGKGPGGDGFTGGGAGGENNTADAPSSYELSKHQGTGIPSSNSQGGQSLNRNPGGSSPIFESAGGGTGHPFGLSGQGFSGNGQYGGGGGAHDNRQRGGAGGFATKGGNGYSNNGGNIHGNTAMVPLAGGSGGGSGNPQPDPILSNPFVTNFCGGHGGGGGGAVQVYSQSIQNISIQVVGGQGSAGDGSNRNGGSGSGGFAGFAAKLVSGGLGATATGGAGAVPGGDGRVRVDAPGTVPGTNPVVGYRGPTTDTSHIVTRSFTLSGTGNGSDLKLFLRGESLNWIELTTLTSPSQNWSVPINITGADSIYFIVAAQKNSTAASGTYRQEPVWVMSQAATNMIEPIGPIIQAETQRKLRVLSCGNTVRDTVMIRNRGNADLILRKPYFSGKQDVSTIAGLTVELPAQWPYIVDYPSKPPKPVDTVPLIVIFKKPPTGGPVYRDTLFIPNNDSDEDRDTFRIFYEITVDTLSIRYASADGQTELPTRIVDLGRICLDADPRDTIIGIKNLSPRSVSPVIPYLDNDNEFSRAWLSGSSLSSGNTGRIRIRFTPPKATGIYRDVLNTSAAAEGCEVIERIQIVAEVVSLAMTTDPSGGQFGNVNIGESKPSFITVTNTGTTTATITDHAQLDPRFRIVSSLPVTLDPGKSVQLQVEFTPDTEGPVTSELRFAIEAAGLCSDSSNVTVLSGIGVRGSLRALKPMIDFGSVALCDLPVADSVDITNSGTGPVTITGNVVISSAAEFSVTGQPVPPYTLQPGESARYYVLYTPGTTAGPITASLNIPHSASALPLSIPIKVESIAFDVEITPSSVDFGPVSLGQTSAAQVVTVKNNGGSGVRINSARINNGAFSVTPDNETIPPGESRQFTLFFTPARIGTEVDSLILEFSSPCAATRIVRLEGTGISGEISADRFSVDFGSLRKCDSSEDSIIIRNTGDADIQLDAGEITGADAQLFRLLSPFVQRVLASKDSVVYRIRFNPASSGEGAKSASFVLTFTNAGNQQQLSISLSGIRHQPFLSTPNPVELGPVELNQKAGTPLTIYNNDPVPLTILEPPTLAGAAGGAISYRAEPPVVYPVTLDSGEFINFIIEFTPADTGDYTDTLKIASQPCDDTTFVTIHGRGVESLSGKVWLPHLVADVNTKDIRIPIYVQLGDGEASLDSMTLKATVYVNETIFLPYALSKGQIASNRSAGGLRRLELTVSNISLSQDSSVATEIIGSALLGDGASTPLILSGVRLEGRRTIQKVDTANGSLTLTGICEEGGIRLISRSQTASIIVVPNPVTGTGEIRLLAQETGGHTIRVYSQDGKLVLEQNWQVAAAGETKMIPVDAAQYTSGIYEIVLVTPTRSVTAPMIIAK